MGTISSGIGLISGINTADLIDQLIAIEARPKALVQRQIAVYQSQQAAFQDISAKLLALKLTASGLTTSAGFKATSVSSSNENVFTATASSTATPGTYQFTVSRLVDTQQTITAGFADRTATPVAPAGGTLTFEFGDAKLTRQTNLSELNGGDGVARGKIRITDRSGATALVDLGAAMTVDDVLEAINNSTAINVRATVNGDGLVLTDLTGATTASLRVQDVGTTGTATALGIEGTAGGDTLAGTAINRIGRNTLLTSLNDGNGVGIVAGNDLRITRSDGSTADVDLSGSVTVGHVLDRLSAAFVGVTADISPDGVSITLTDSAPPGGGAMAIAALNGSTAAGDLGLLKSGTNSQISGDRAVATLNSRLLRNLHGGAGATLGALSITNRAGVVSNLDLTGLTTISQVIDAINAGAAGVQASLNNAGNGLKLTDTTGATASNFIVSGASATALNLGVDDAVTSVDSGNLQFRYLTGATLLSALQGGAGIARGQFIITDSSGASATVDLTQGNETTIQDVLDEINSRGLQINARVNDTGDGILIEDTGPGTVALKVEESGSTTAADLGLLGEAANPGDHLVGSFEKTITIEATDTLDTVVSKINNAGLNVKASVIHDGSASAPYRLSLLASKGGGAGAFVFDDGGLGWSAQTLTAARDAVVFYGSTDPASAIAITSTSNTLTALVPGATITLKGASASPVQLVVNSDDSAIKQKIQKFVSDFNAVLDTLDKYDKYDADTQTRGLLLGDSTVGVVRSALYRVVNNASGDLTSRYNALHQIGVTVKSGARLSLDDAKLTAALATDPAAVEALFTYKVTQTDEATGETSVAKAGVGVRIDELLKSLTDSQTGSLQTRVESLDQQIQLGHKRIENLDVLLAAKRLRLQTQFNQMETVLANLQAQGNALTSLQNLALAIGQQRSQSR